MKEYRLQPSQRKWHNFRLGLGSARYLKGKVPKALLSVPVRRNNPSNVVHNFLTVVRRRAKRRKQMNPPEVVGDLRAGSCVRHGSQPEELRLRTRLSSQRVEGLFRVRDAVATTVMPLPMYPRSHFRQRPTLPPSGRLQTYRQQARRADRPRRRAGPDQICAI
jgi:hypothetical protein